MSTTRDDGSNEHDQQHYSHFHGRLSSSGHVFCVDMNQFHETTASTKPGNRNHSQRSVSSASTGSIYGSDTRGLISPNTSVEPSLTLAEIREEGLQGDDDDESWIQQPNRQPPQQESSRTTNYFHRSYDTFLSSLRSIGSSHYSVSSRSNLSRGAEEEELILHDRMPPYTSIV